MARVPIKIPAELFALAESSRFEGAYDLGKLTVGPDDYRFDNPVSWSVEVTNTGSAFLVLGTVTGEAICACSRCLEDVPITLTGAIEGYFIIEGIQADDSEEFGEEEMPGDDEFDVLPADHIIDLAPLLDAALIVDVPQKPLCRDDCAGLCVSCGANLNEGPCGCDLDKARDDFDRASNPFSVLADYKFE